MILKNVNILNSIKLSKKLKGYFLLMSIMCEIGFLYPDINNTLTIFDIKKGTFHPDIDYVASFIHALESLYAMEELDETF